MWLYWGEEEKKGETFQSACSLPSKWELYFEKLSLGLWFPQPPLPFPPGLQPNQVWVCFTLHTAECLPGSHTSLSHQLDLSPVANTPEEDYSSTGGVSATGWVLHFNKKLYKWECLFCMEDARVIKKLLKLLLSDDCVCILPKFHSTGKDSKWTYFISSRHGK